MTGSRKSTKTQKKKCNNPSGQATPTLEEVSIAPTTRKNLIHTKNPIRLPFATALAR